MNLPYELAKQLKEAGFPQRSRGGINASDIGAIYQPTLEELVNACGEGFALFSPNKQFLPLKKVEGTALFARTEPRSIIQWAACSRDAEIVCRGLTAIEATAKLCIALLTKEKK